MRSMQRHRLQVVRGVERNVKLLRFEDKISSECKRKNNTPFESFNPSFSTPYDVIPSIEPENAGYVQKPKTFTFTMVIETIGTAEVGLTKMAMEGNDFQIVVTKYEVNDRVFKSVALNRCKFYTHCTVNVYTLCNCTQARHFCLHLFIGAVVSIYLRSLTCSLLNRGIPALCHFKATKY